MLRSVALKSLRDQRMSLFWWALGLVALAAVTVLLYPSIGAAPEMARLLEDAPEALLVLIGEVADITSPAGYLNSQLFFFMVPLLLLIFAIAQGSGAVAGEEERGTLELLLSTPLSRARLVVEKFATMVVATLAIGIALWLGLVASAWAIDMEIGLGRLAEATLSAVLLGLLYGALALALGAARGRRGFSMGVASAAAVAGYFLYALAPLVEQLEPYRRLSPFYYYIGADPLSRGLDPAHVAVLVAATLALLLVAVFAFERRDLAV